ncbi:unnamed protein product, partial [marine sediment metagenome]
HKAQGIRDKAQAQGISGKDTEGEREKVVKGQS